MSPRKPLVNVVRKTQLKITQIIKYSTTVVCVSDLVALRNDLMLFLQDVDDVFAIRLGFVLSDTVVIVHDGHDLCKIQEQVNEYLDHFNAVPTRDNDVVSDYRGLVRKTTNIFVVVNFAHGSFKVNYEVNFVCTPALSLLAAVLLCNYSCSHFIIGQRKKNFAATGGSLEV